MLSGADFARRTDASTLDTGDGGGANAGTAGGAASWQVLLPHTWPHACMARDTRLTWQQARRYGVGASQQDVDCVLCRCSAAASLFKAIATVGAHDVARWGM